MQLTTLGLDSVLGRAVCLMPFGAESVSADYVKWLNDDRVRKYLENRFEKQTKANVKAFVANCNNDPNTLLLGIHANPGLQHVGNIKLHWSPHHMVADIGLMIGATGSWQRGIGTESIALMTKLAFTSLGLRKIVAGIYDGNIGSLRAFERCGYQVEAILKEHVLTEGQPTDLLQLRLFRQAWAGLVEDGASGSSGLPIS